MNNTPDISVQKLELSAWIERLEHVRQLMDDPTQQDIVQGFLKELTADPVKGNIFRLRLETGHAIRFTLEMCVVEQVNASP